ncbi:MAG: efflux RND transporter permease subunit, partial [Prevotella sp.]|nr:efflux RND transporter permease subunit [Prevotella sp.]
PEAYVRFKRLDFLEVGEMEYRFYGDNLDSLHYAAEQLMDRMRQIPELEWVHTDFMQPQPIVNVELDPVASAQMGISRTTAALALSSLTGNTRVGQVWEGDYELPVVMKDSADLTFSDVQNLGLSTSQTMLSTALPTFLGGSSGGNATVKLRQVARVEPRWSETRIMHRGGERCLTVTAQLAHGAYASKVEQQVADIMHNDVRLPEGVRSQVGGEMEYDGEALPQIFGGVGIAMIIIFFFLLANFKKYGITSVCMIALALMLPGALLGLGLMNRTLGLTSVMGFITLMGMIMRNEILIFEHANDLVRRFVESHPKPEEVNDEMKEAYRREYNEAVRQAAYDAGRRRMVPIFLTTATTAVGVVPMILAQSSFWMPVGVTIFAGGIGSLIMVVSVLPVVYWKVSLK